MNLFVQMNHVYIFEIFIAVSLNNVYFLLHFVGQPIIILVEYISCAF